MDAAQLTSFEAATQAFDASVTPMEVTLGEETFQAAGSWAEHMTFGLQDGGRAEQSLAHFTIPKADLPEAPALGALVTIDGTVCQISKIWGRDLYDPNWSFRAVRFTER